MSGIGSHKTENFRKIAKQLVGLTVALLLFFSTSVTALAYDVRYLEMAYWQAQETINIPIDKSGAQGNLTGSIKYFTRDQSAYFLFDLCESPNNEVTSLFFEFSNDNYAFSVDENGIFNMADSEVEGKYFDIGVNFYTDSANHGICLIAMDINDGIYTHYFNIIAYVNGHRYTIADNLEIITYPPPQTTKPEKTTTQKQTTTKEPKETTTKTTTEKTTKFKYNGEDIEIQPTTQQETESVSYDFYDASVNQNTKTFTKRQIIMTSTAAVLAFLGALILGLSLLRPKQQKKTRTQNENSNDDTDDKPIEDNDGYDF